MTEEGKAVLFILLPDGRTTTDVFLESESDLYDPEDQCERTLASVGDDFPGMMYAIAMNDRARELMKNRRMREMGFTEEEFQWRKE